MDTGKRTPPEPVEGHTVTISHRTLAIVIVAVILSLIVILYIGGKAGGCWIAPWGVCEWIVNAIEHPFGKEEPRATCEDGTRNYFCSSNRPYLCTNKQLIYSPSACGCPESMILEGDICRNLKDCLSTYHDSCSLDKPLYCYDGNLSEKASVCGCPSGYITQGDTCRKPRYCSDGTAHNSCSKTQPNFCDDGSLYPDINHCGCPPNSIIEQNTCRPKRDCSDGTEDTECSEDKPYYCYDGNLVQKATVCGCPDDFTKDGNSCKDPLSWEEMTESPKEIPLRYTLRGQSWKVTQTVYGGLYDYLGEKPRTYTCPGGICPDTRTLLIKYVDEPHQKKAMQSLLAFISKYAEEEDDDARMAISIVQKIPYGKTSDTVRFAYETLYDNEGVCGDKSILLATILKELGYGVVLFYYDYDPGHMAVGIKCSDDYDYLDSGFCFVESNDPTIITYSNGNYGEDMHRLPEPDEIIFISDGKTFDASTEYADALRYDFLTQGQTLSVYQYNEWVSLVNEYGLNYQ